MSADMTAEHHSRPEGGELYRHLREIAKMRFVDHNGIAVPWFIENTKPAHDDPNRPDYLNQIKTFDYVQFDPGVEYKPKGSTYELESNPGRKLENPFDLRNLRFFNAEEVVNTVEQLERLASEPGDLLTCIVGTGGTIASKKVGDVRDIGANLDEIFEFSGYKVDRDWKRTGIELPTLIDSSQMKIDYDADVAIVISYIWKKLSERAKTKLQGFVVAHGTDTMAQSASRLSMMLGPNLEFSVGMVGSQLGMDDPDNEIPVNLHHTLENLKRLKAANRNTVFVYMGGTDGAAFHPAGVIKMSDTKIAGFDSPAMLPIYKAGDKQFARLELPFTNTYQALRNPWQDPFQPTIVRGWGTTVNIDADMDVPLERLNRMFGLLNREDQLRWDKIANKLTEDEADFIRQLMGVVRPADRAIMAETYGSYTFDKGQVDVIQRGARERGLLWFATNPFPTGGVHDYESSEYLIKAGATPLAMLRHAGAAKLMLGEAWYGKDNERLQAFLTSNNLLGEQTTKWVPKLDSKVEKEMRDLGQPRESIPPEPLPVYP